MIADRLQREVLAFLDAPASHGGVTVERVDTHTAVVFLVGSRALKMKRAVRFDYVDFSTLERRRAMCEAEVRLNRRTAPSLYRGTLAVTRRADGALALGGEGAPVEWLVEMARFDQEALFDRLAERGQLDQDLMPALADAVVRLHADAARRDDHGGRAGMQWVVDGNARGFADFGRGALDAQDWQRLTARALAAVERQAARLDRRRASGRVRQCHGDLHLRNIVRLDARPTLFDAIEFNDELACVDVLYDLAFLLMDLWRRALPAHANLVWTRYLQQTDDVDGAPLLPLFLSCRAAIRAKTSVTAAAMLSDTSGEPAEARRQMLHRTAREYLAMAERLLTPPPTRLVAIGGLSGSGKSTVARRMAPEIGAVPGAVLLRSDELRKDLFGVAAHVRLGPEGYRPEVTARVYAALAARARALLAAGQSVIVDAVHTRAADRKTIETVAAESGARFTGLWLHAPPDVLLARVASRVGDASDAGTAMVARQVANTPTDVSWQRVDASPSALEVADTVRAALAGHE